MFTGIIEETGNVMNIRSGAHAAQITISAAAIFDDVKPGDSINTQGACLTVTGLKGKEFIVDVMPETMKRTTLGELRPGSKVNLERALRLSDRLGGHLVSGHIDGTGRVTGIHKEEIAIRITVAADKAILKYIVEKGSVALDGVSLTVTKVDENSFEVSLIPYTQKATTLDALRTGDRLNIECDLVAKYLEKLNNTATRKIDMNFLAEHGF